MSDRRKRQGEKFTALTIREAHRKGDLREVGRILSDLRGKLAFGEYGAWIDANCPFGSRQGRRYVAEYEREKIDRMKSQPPPEPPPAETPPPPEPPPGTILKITDEKKHPIFNGGRCPKCNTRKIKLVEPEDPRDVRYFECQICGTCVEVRWNPLDSFDEEGWREPGEGKLDWMR